jgi:Tol biopolymer transport system component
LAIYDREKGTLKELPGANDLNYVQSNAVWTPDDKHIIFARAEAIPYPDTNTQYKSFIDDNELIEAYVTGKKKMKYDLFIIPFNDGEGGKAIPVKGASMNNKSNYFPAVSPDGKWLAYCQSDNLMMLRPDSRIHMTSLETGKSNKLKSNFTSMNSWHSWSPNGKWLVFSSKAFSTYTDMLLTHIDKNGKASIPVLLENSHATDRAVNYPEFINISPDFTFTMDYNYINIRHIYDVIEKKKDTTYAKELLIKFLEQEQVFTPEEYLSLGHI